MDTSNLEYVEITEEIEEQDKSEDEIFGIKIKEKNKKNNKKELSFIISLQN